MKSPLRKLRIEPIPISWVGHLGLPSAAKLRFREQVGLPAGPPVVLSGHQADLWHPGILAKMFASIAFAEHASKSLGAHVQASWLVVDQDEPERVGLRLPVRDSAGKLKAFEWRWADVAGRTSGGLSAVLPSEPALKKGEQFASESVSAGVGAVRAAMGAAASDGGWARQVSVAAARLLSPIVQAPHFVFESNLAKTDLFQRIAEGMAANPVGAVRAYNAAVRATPDAGMRPLDEARGEVPLWHVNAGVRRRVLASDLASGSAKIDRSQLAPRGLLMTAIMRLAGCELFIHGTGGALYDKATEAWVRAWPEPLAAIANEFGGVRSLAPMTMVTADLLLPLADEEMPGETEIAKGVWLAHHARHDPMTLGDREAAAAKSNLLEQIRLRKRRGEHPREEFSALHELLSRTRAKWPGEIDRLRSEAAILVGQREEAALANDRTWSFALHPPESLRQLMESCRRAWNGHA